MNRSTTAVVDRLLWAGAGLCVLMTIVWSLGPVPPGAGSFANEDKVLHALAYAATVLLLVLAADRRPGRATGPFPGSAPWIALIAIAAGGALELLQHLTGRDTELLDWVADIAGTAIGLLIWVWIGRVAAPGPRVPSDRP